MIIITHFIAFIVGIVTGAAGMYYGQKFTDRRREKENQKRNKDQFQQVQKQMPQLIAEMKKDLNNPEHQFIREFFVTSDKLIVKTQDKYFFYYTEKHGDLQCKIHILENHGYIIDVTPGDAPKYRMTEEFVKLILDSK